VSRYLTTAPVFTPSVVNWVSDKERKLSACEINLAWPLVPEDRENKLFRNVGNYYHAIRRRIRRTQIFITPVWQRKILHCFVEANTECWIHWKSLALSECIHCPVTHHVPSCIIKCKHIAELQIITNKPLFSENLFPAWNICCCYITYRLILKPQWYPYLINTVWKMFHQLVSLAAGKSSLWKLHQHHKISRVQLTHRLLRYGVSC
jgi:hypothetical protein